MEVSLQFVCGNSLLTYHCFLSLPLPHAESAKSQEQIPVEQPKGEGVMDSKQNSHINYTRPPLEKQYSLASRHEEELDYPSDDQDDEYGHPMGQVAHLDMQQFDREADSTAVYHEKQAPPSAHTLNEYPPQVTHSEPHSHEQSAKFADPAKPTELRNTYQNQPQIQAPSHPSAPPTFNQTPPTQYQTPPTQGQTPPIQYQAPSTHPETTSTQDQSLPPQYQAPSSHPQTPPTLYQTPPTQDTPTKTTRKRGFSWGAKVTAHTFAARNLIMHTPTPPPATPPPRPAVDTPPFHSIDVTRPPSFKPPPPPPSNIVDMSKPQLFPSPAPQSLGSTPFPPGVSPFGISPSHGSSQFGNSPAPSAYADMGATGGGEGGFIDATMGKYFCFIIFLVGMMAWHPHVAYGMTTQAA